MATAATAPPQREQVFCHECRHEWYRDEHGLVCPNELCRSDFVEIIESNNDPRNLPPSDDSDSDDEPDLPFLRAFGIPRPSEGATIRETPAGTSIRVSGPGYTFVSQTTYSGPRRTTSETEGHRLGGEPGQPHQEIIADMFSTMLRNIVGDQFMRQAHQEAGHRLGEDGDRPRSENGENRPYIRTFHTTFGTGGGLNPRNADASQQGDTDVPDINAFLQSLFGPASEGDNRIPPALARLFGVPSGAGGDYVYSQTELDRIVSQLMEQHQGNAPPPAAKEDIEALPRIKVTQEMVNDGIDCAVCKEDLVLDEEVASLPCKHNYHFECVSKWLEAHNTCPICRHPITSEERQREQQQQRHQQSSGATFNINPSGIAATIPFLGLFGPSWNQTRPSNSQNNSQENSNSSSENPENNQPPNNPPPRENQNQHNNSTGQNGSNDSHDHNSGNSGTGRNVHSAFASLFRRRGS